MKTKSKGRQNKNVSYVPRVLFKIFAASALVLVPWTIWLSLSLPADHIAGRWDLVWTGFDAGLILVLAATAYFGLRRSVWVVATASVAGAFLLVDAWFDCLTARSGVEYFQSLSSAALAEIPLALAAFWIAYRVGSHFAAK